MLAVQEVALQQTLVAWQAGQMSLLQRLMWQPSAPAVLLLLSKLAAPSCLQRPQLVVLRVARVWMAWQVVGPCLVGAAYHWPVAEAAVDVVDAGPGEAAAVSSLASVDARLQRWHMKWIRQASVGGPLGEALVQ